MFDFIRTHRRWMQLILLLLIVPAFAFFGIEGYVGFMSKDKELAEVNGTAITLPEFDQARRIRLEELRSVLGAQFDAQAIDTAEFRQNLLDEMINQRVIAAAAIEGRYTVSDEALRQTIADVPALQENGVFSPERYRQVLASQGMTPADFEIRLRSDLILSQVLAPIGQTAVVPQEVVSQLVKALTQERAVEIRRFTQAAYANDVQVTESDIKEWYEKNAETLRLPESIDFEYVVIDEPAATKGVKVSDAEIEHYYQQNQNRFGQPERRRVSHVLFAVPPNADEATKAQIKAKAEEAASALKADPSKFADVAREKSEDPGSASQGGDLGWISKETLLPEIEAVVFKLNKGDVSDVVETPFGYHVAMVTDLQDASVKPLAQVRDEIIKQIRTQLAAARYSDMASQLTNLVYDQRDALEPIAQQLGVELRRVEGFVRDGLLSDALLKREVAVTDDVQALLSHPRVRQVAFAEEVMRTAENSGVIEIAPDTVMALRVTKVHPSVIPSQEQASPLIRQLLLDERALAKAREAGKSLMTDLQNPSQQAQGFGPEQVVSRQNPRDLSPVELRAVMTHPEAQVPGVIGVDIPDGYAVIRILRVQPGVALSAAEIEQFRRQLAEAWGQKEQNSALAVLRQQYGAVVTPEGRALIDGLVEVGQ